jgi:hypothetical protein
VTKPAIRRLPWIAAAAFLAAVGLWLAKDPRIPRQAFQEYSVYNVSPGGLSLAFRYLEAEGRTVRVLSRPLERAFLPAEAVLFRIRPDSAVPPGLRPPRQGGG